MTLRELIHANQAKQRYDWDHTADQLAMMATLHTTGRFQRGHFHPLRELPERLLHLDDPGAEYARLMEHQKK